MTYLNKVEINDGTIDDKRSICEIYGHCFLGRFYMGDRINRSLLIEAENWFEKSVDCYDQMWDELKRDIDRITWSDRWGFVNMIGRLQFIKFLLEKKEEALVVAERYRARSFRDTMQTRQLVENQFSVCQLYEIKAVVNKLEQPIVYFSHNGDDI